jgi:hypothetical protein
VNGTDDRGIVDQSALGMREAFFFAWSVLDLALIVVATLADGGTSSPFALIFFVPVVFAAMSYPVGSVIGVGGLTLAGYLTLAVTVGGSSWGYEALFAVMLGCAGVMSAWLAGNQERQRAALMEVSRADPLTGCLNRRGFEERAVAEIEAATRRARKGAVLLLDVDHFKQVNDRHGHAAGDALLAGSCRRSGTACGAPMRSGGSAATSSRCCSRTSSRATRWRRQHGSARRSASARRARWGWRASRWTARIWRS